jgi:lipopolysaccharide assembly outer membrane protein LptD (OstA)
MNDNDAIKELANELRQTELQLPAQIDNGEQLKEQLALRINYLITANFSLLVSILYRLDISEKKLKYFLSQPQQMKAGDIIADMIIERQLQKLASRQLFKGKFSNAPDDEKW